MDLIFYINYIQSIFLNCLASSKQDIGGGSTPMATPKQVKTSSETNINNDDTMLDSIYYIYLTKLFKIKIYFFIVMAL